MDFLSFILYPWHTQQSLVSLAGQPTKLAITHFLDRMPKGSVIVFDELNEEAFPGETLAVLETIGVKNLRIQRFAFEPRISYAILE